jgi:hypothetical protein
VLILALATASAGAEERIALRYDVSFGAFRVASLESRSLVGDGWYWQEIRMRTVGLVDRLFPWMSRSDSSGVIGDDLLRPVRYQAETVYRQTRRWVSVAYSGDGLIGVEADPSPDPESAPPVPPALYAGTIDPQTATLLLVRRAAAGQPCSGVQRIFDGWRRYDLRLEEAGSAEIAPVPGAPYAGPVSMCDAIVEPIAGFRQKDLSPRGVRPRLRYWLAPVLQGVSPIPARIDLSGRRGSLKGILAEARVLEPAPPSRQ